MLTVEPVRSGIPILFKSYSSLLFHHKLTATSGTYKVNQIDGDFFYFFKSVLL
jgi:hypothetical protein